MFSIASNTNARLGSIFLEENECGSWNPSFRRSFHGWELEKSHRFFDFIQPVSVRDSVEGGLVWSGIMVGSLSVMCCYPSLYDNIFLKFQIKGFGSPFVYVFLSWEVVLGKILTMDPLMKRGWQLANRCCICGSKDELTCRYCSEACMLWDLVLALFGYQRVLPKTIRELLLAWQGLRIQIH